MEKTDCPIPEDLYNRMFMEVCNLTPHERHLILDVMIRDERLRKRDQHKVNLMKAELQELRRKGALRPSIDGECAMRDGGRSCSRCRAELGWIVNRGAVCPACRLRVCRACREYTVRTIDWVCTVCYKRTEIQTATGEWMNEFVRKPGQNRFYMSAADIIKSTIRRSWTISDPTPRWPPSRDSPEFRPYNSLPRGQDVSDYPTLTRTNPENNKDKSDDEDIPIQRQRRISLFEKTLSELYDNGGKRSKKNSIDKTDKEEIKKNDLKPSKIPSPRRKIHTARSDTAAVISKKEPVKKFSSLQNKKSLSNSSQEKHVSFEQEDIKPVFKSGIPRRDSKADKKEEKPVNVENTTEIQINDEADMVEDNLFRKVAVRRRKHEMKKSQAFDEGTQPDVDTRILPEGDDYKLVFISSAEEDNDSASSSSATAHSYTIDDCDWDYFEPSSSIRPVLREWRSPWGSPRVYRRSVLESPYGSPRFYRARESDGTDEDITRVDSGSPASSDSVLSRVRSSSENEELESKCQVSRRGKEAVKEVDGVQVACRSCGAAQQTTQLIPVPVLVPIPVPIPANLWNPLESLVLSLNSAAYESLDANLRMRLRSIQQRAAGAMLCSGVNPTSLISPLITGEAATLLSTVQHSLLSASGDMTPETCKPSPSPERNPDQQYGTEHAATEPTDVHTTSDNGETMTEQRPEEQKPSEVASLVNGGYLQSDRTYMSSSESSDSNTEEAGVRKPRVRRVYNVSGGVRESDDALPESDVSSEEDKPGRNSRSSVSREEMSSSGSEDTDSDDTGTVADQKPKRFSRVFVVNNNDSSSDVEDNTDSSDTDTSDNDTDTERDCVVLNYIKPLSDESNSDSEPVILLKHIKSGESGDTPLVESQNVSEKSEESEGGNVVLLRHTMCSESAGEILVSAKIDTLSNGVSDSIIDRENSVVNTSSDVLHRDNVNTTLSDGIESVSAENVESTSAFCGEKNMEFISDCLVVTKESAIDLETVKMGTNTVSGNREMCNPEAGSAFNIPEQRGESEEGNVREQSEVGEWSEERGVLRCDEVQEVEGETIAQTGAPEHSVESEPRIRGYVPTRYTSLVMITQEPPLPQVSIVPSDTTTIVPSDVIVRHTNWDEEDDDERTPKSGGLAGYFTVALEEGGTGRTNPRRPLLVKSPQKNGSVGADSETVTVLTSPDTLLLADSDPTNAPVTVLTGGDTLSAVVCLEDGLADDDSWVEDISYDEDEFATTTATDSSSGEEVTLQATPVIDHEEELRGYHRSAIDFTLHTIVEESCEESEVEQSQPSGKTRPTSATDLEKYFFFRLGDGTVPNTGTNREDAYSETSSIYSEGMDSLGTPDDAITNDNVDPAELASSRLEKYFLSGFMGFTGAVGTGERRDSDGSVGSDSEGRPSPEQRRKRLVRARGTGRSHSSSLDNLLATANDSAQEHASDAQHGSEDSSSSESDTLDELSNNFEKSDGQFDTVKRKKCKKSRMTGSSSPQEEKKGLETTMEEVNENKTSDDEEDGHKTPQPEYLLPLNSDLGNSRKQQSRDSGFIGSCDDLLKEQKPETNEIKTQEKKKDLEKITEEKKIEEKQDKHYSTPPATSLTRKDSFNNWSSDEETNLMMSKMRQFFKTMIAANSGNPHINSKPTTPILNHESRPVPSPRTKRNKPPQLVYFENELTRLMKTVPGIRDDQVREIVEYLSSEDTWSDSYDSSDYTSSDLEGASVAKSVLQQQISDSCQQIINKFDHNVDDEGDEGDGGILDESQGLNRETAFVYQKLVASFNKMATGDSVEKTPNNSPPLIAKVMHHIGSRLVALMHEVSSGESHCSTSPKVRYHHRRLQQKLSSASTTTTEDDDSTSDRDNLPDPALEDGIAQYILPRSRSHDLLLGDARAHHQSSSGVSDIAEEKEASDYERFSWRGSFESALMATDSRQKLSLLGQEGSGSVSALAMAAKRRSAGDLLFSPKSLSREQLDRVRSCGSIGGGNSDDKHWVVTPAVRPTRRRSSVPDATCGSGGSADGEDDDDDDRIENRSTTLPRSLQTGTATTNSLPRLPTSANAANMHKAHSMHHFLQHNVKSARYRPPGFNRQPAQTAPKRAVSAPGLQPSHPRNVRRRSQQPAASSDDVSIADSNSSPIVGVRNSKSASPSPVHSSTLTRGTGSISSADWNTNEDDIDRLVAMHHNRTSLSSLGLRSDSMASVYSGAGEGRYGNVAVKGQVEFALQYNYKAGDLEIHVKQCRDLAPVDVKRNRSDPYVKVYLLPDKSKSGKRKTKVKKHTLNPVFDECLKFHSTLSGLETRTLWLTVWHSDMFGRNDFLGEVMMALENKVFDDPTPKWYNLQERTEPFEELPTYKGDIVVGLKFVPPDMTVQKKGKRSRGALHVLVKEAKNLTAVKANGTSDPFCKSYLLPDKGRSNKQKTPIVKKTTSPVWNHSFVYDDVTLQELAERSLELTVWDHDRLASNEFLGGVRFSLATGKHYGKVVDWMDASGKELLLWQSMLERPNFWVEGCVSLRSSLDHRSY